MKSPRRVMAVLVALAALAFATEVRAQVVATVSDFKGDVTINEAATRTPRSVAFIPNTNRIANGSLITGDEVVTGAGAEATIRFTDGSSIQLAPSTRAAVNEIRLSGPRKAIQRHVKLDAGRIVCDIRPSEAIYTVIRCASGYAGVAGAARFTAAFADDRLSLDVDSGRVYSLDPSGNLALPLSDRQRAVLQLEASDVSVVRVESDAGRPIPAAVGADQIRMDAGDAIRVAPSGGSTLKVTVVAGAVDLTRGASGLTQPVAGSESFVVEGQPKPVAPLIPLPPPEATPDVPMAVAPFAAGAPRPAAVEAPPPLPAIPAVGDTVESSPIK
jgi:ferric-dicitrate binding protein FerR (iron transport regulator)